MNQTKISLPQVIVTKPSMEFSNFLNGTSADMRFLPDVQYTASGESTVIDVDFFDQERYYRLLKKPSTVLEELQREHA